MAFTPPPLDTEEAGGFTPPALNTAEFTPPPLDSAAPEPVGTVRGLVASAQRGVKNLTSLPNTLALINQMDSAQRPPSLRQERQAYVRAMSDPRYMLAAMEDPVAAEAQFGAQAQLESARQISPQLVQQFMANQAATAALPQSEAQQELATTPDRWSAWRKNPIELTSSIILESLPASVAGALAGSVAGPAGTAAGAGASSAALTFSSEFLGSAAHQGYNITEPDRLQAFMEDRPAFDQAMKVAQIKAGIIGTLDTATAGLAGRFIEPALKQGLKQIVIASGKELGTQVAGGAGGEALAQAASGQPLDSFDIAMEGIAEIGSAPAEVFSNIRQGRKLSTPPSTIRQTPNPIPQTPARFSEFGDEATPNPALEAAANEFNEAKAKEQGTARTESKPPVAEHSVASPATPPPQTPSPIPQTPNAIPQTPSAIADTVEETPNTIYAQVDWLRRGKRAAVMLPAGAPVPEWVLKDNRFATHETPAGMFLFDTAALTGDEITRAVQADRIGDVLGYGIPTKPAPGTEVGTIVVRDKQGTEKQAVVTDAANLPNVLKRAQQMADEGDVVKLETPEQVIAGRVQDAQTQTVRTIEPEDRSRAYAEARAYRDAQKAAEAAAAAKAVESQTPDARRHPPSPIPHPPSAIPVTESHLAQARQVVAELSGQQNDRAPDILDDIEGQVTNGAIQFPADLADAIDASRERVAGALHGKPFKRLSSAQRKRINAALRASTTEGMAADQAQHGIGEKYAGLTQDDFANAILDAAEARLLETRKADSAEVKAMAEEIAKAEAGNPELTPELTQDEMAALERAPVEAAAEPPTDELIPFSLDNAATPQDSGGTYGRTKETAALQTLQTALANLGFTGRVTARPPVRGGGAGSHAESAGTVAGALREFERVFGRRIVLFDAGGDTQAINGLVLPQDPHTLYLNHASRHTPMVVLGHEFLESLKLTHPELYSALHKELLPLLKDVPEYQARLNRIRQRTHLTPADRAHAEKEMIADFVGDALARPGYWRTLAEHNATLFAEVATAMRQFLNWVLDAIQPFGARRWITDLHRAEQSLTRTLEAFVRDQREQGRTGTAAFSLEMPAQLNEPGYVAARKAELDQIAQDLYGKSYDDLTEFNQGNIQVTLEAEDAHRAVQGRQQRDASAGRQPVDPRTQAQPRPGADAGQPAALSRDAQTVVDLRAQWQRARHPVTRRLVSAMLAETWQRLRRASLQETQETLEQRRSFLSPLAAQVLASVRQADGTVNLKRFKALSSQAVNTVVTVQQLDNALAAVRQSLASATSVIYPGTEGHVLSQMEQHVGLKPNTDLTPLFSLDDAQPRATGQKIEASSDISADVKRRITEYLYAPRRNRTDQQTADGLVQEFGVASAIQTWHTPPDGLPGAVRSKLLRSITRALAAAERQARIAGDTAQMEALIEQQRALWDVALRDITDTAQELQALNDLVAMSPDAHVARAKREVQQAGEKEIERHRGETDAMRTALDEGRTQGVEAVRTDAEVNTAAREAVNETVKNSEETQRAIIMELAEPWSKSEYIVNHAREAVRAKANELLNRQPRPAGFTPAQHLRQILDDLAARAASIFAGHIQGSEPGVLLVDKLTQRLGIDKAHASKLASSLSKEWDKQLDLARKKLDTRLANARARQERREREPESNAAVDRALRRQLREMNLKLGEAIRQAAADRHRTGEHIADRIVQASGLTGEQAEALRQKLAARYDALTADAQRAALAAIEARGTVKVKPKLKTAFDRLIELDRLAPVNGEAFFNAVRVALKLPTLTDAQAKQLRALVLEAQAKPEGWQQQRVMAKVFTLTESAKGALAWYDVPFAIWYAHIFSGLPTHIANLVGNTAKALDVVGIESQRNPLATGQIIKAFARGFETGTLEAGSVLLTGQIEGTRLLKAEAARPLEARIQQGGWNKIWLPWAAVSRLMAAEDVVFFKAHEEIKWQLLARRIAKQEGLRGEQLDARVQDLMHNTRAEYEAAKVQAAKEGLSGLDMRRRAHEIIEQARERDMDGSTEIARRFALEHTFNSEPYGVMGRIAKALNYVNQTLVVTRFAIPVVRIMANLANESLNYFPPVGLARILVPRWRSDIQVRAKGDVDALASQQARVIVGTVLFGALLAAMAGDDDDEAVIELTGQGPRTKAQREQLRSTGWKPNALRVGNRWYSYQETQLAIPLAILGNYSDAVKYKGLDQQDALNRTAYTLQTTLNTVLDQRMLSGVGDLMDALAAEQRGEKELGQFLTRAATSFVVPNAVKWIDQVFDPAVYEPDDVAGAIYAQTPFARRLNRPAVNALGDPVTRAPFDRFTSPAKPDALVKIIAQKKAWIPMPDFDNATVGNPRLGEDYQRPMTPDEYHTWIATSGPEIRRRLTDNLDRLAQMTDDEAQSFVAAVAREERAAARPQR